MSNTTKDYRNILSIWLGSLIGKHRKKNGVSLEHLGKVMGGLQPSYLRMVENGLTNISPARVLDLLNGLNNTFGIEAVFHTLSKYLVAMQVLSVDLSSIENIRTSLATLKDAGDPMLKALIPVLFYPEIWILYKERDYDQLKEMLISDRSYLDSLTKYLRGENIFLDQPEVQTKKCVELPKYSLF